MSSDVFGEDPLSCASAARPEVEDGDGELSPCPSSATSQVEDGRGELSPNPAATYAQSEESECAPVPCPTSASPQFEDGEGEPLPHLTAAYPQFGDDEDEWHSKDSLFADFEHLQPPPQNEDPEVSGDGVEDLDFRLFEDYSGENQYWTTDTTCTFPAYTDINEENSYLHNDSSAKRTTESDVMKAESVNEKLNSVENVENSDCNSYRLLNNSTANCDETQLLHSDQSLMLNMFNKDQNGLMGASVGNSVRDEEDQANEFSLGDADTSLTDDSVVLEPSASAADSLNTSHSSSPTSSPFPPPPGGAGMNIACAATGIPLQHGPPRVGQTCFVRVHPMHVAAAVAAQHSRVAAVTHQRNLMAAAAAQQHAAAVAQQRLAAAAAHQRTQAAMMQQHLVRSRYVGAPVVVRPPAFVPVPSVAAPVRVRMRVRRSVTMTEEYSMDRP